MDPARGPGLRQLLAGPALIVAPGCYDVVGARLIEHAGFPAAYMTGSGVSMSVTGLPDIGLVSLHEALDRLGQIAGAIRLPVIADGDTGFGNPLNVLRTVREFERRGAAAIQLEDQEMPKKCGHTPNRRVVSARDMVRKIEVAVQARRSADTLIIARTDARAGLGLDEAIARGRAYRKAGADVIFVEAPTTEGQIETIARRIPQPKLINMFEGGKTPLVPLARLRELGYRIVIIPSDLQRAAIRAMEETLAAIRRDGNSRSVADRMASFDDREAVVGTPEYMALDRRYRT